MKNNDDDGMVLYTINTTDTLANFPSQIGRCSVLRLEVSAFNRAGYSNKSESIYNELTGIIIMLRFHPYDY